MAKKPKPKQQGWARQCLSVLVVTSKPQDDCGSSSQHVCIPSRRLEEGAALALLFSPPKPWLIVSLFLVVMRFELREKKVLERHCCRRGSTTLLHAGVLGETPV
jgi:hypothetical protein